MPANEKIGGIYMLKKSLIAVLFSLIMALGLGTSAFATEDIHPVKYNNIEEVTPEIAKALAEVEKTNAKIFAEIEKAVVKYEKMNSKFQEQKSKHKDPVKLAEITEEYESKTNKLITDLKIKTESMTLKGIEKAEKAGLVMKIELVLVKFADREELIDPMVVVGW